MIAPVRSPLGVPYRSTLGVLAQGTAPPPPPTGVDTCYAAIIREICEKTEDCPPGPDDCDTLCFIDPVLGVQACDASDPRYPFRGCFCYAITLWGLNNYITKRNFPIYLLDQAGDVIFEIPDTNCLASGLDILGDGPAEDIDIPAPNFNLRLQGTQNYDDDYRTGASGFASGFWIFSGGDLSLVEFEGIQSGTWLDIDNPARNGNILDMVEETTNVWLDHFSLKSDILAVGNIRDINDPFPGIGPQIGLLPKQQTFYLSSTVPIVLPPKGTRLGYRISGGISQGQWRECFSYTEVRAGPVGSQITVVAPGHTAQAGGHIWLFSESDPLVYDDRIRDIIAVRPDELDVDGTFIGTDVGVMAVQ